MRNIRKGSITIWLSLVMCVILALIAACIQSARLSAARAFVSICVDESLFSEFARYDRILYDKYGLLAVNAGFGGNSIDFSAIAGEIEDAAEELVSVNEDLFRISLKETDITGYVCATDSGAAALRSQISELMTKKLGVDGVNRLANMVNTNAPVIKQQEDNGTTDPESIRDAYEVQKAEGAARRAEAEAAAAAAEEVGESGVPGETENGQNGLVEVPEDFENPIDNIENIMRMGIYNTILPDPLNVSNRGIDTGDLAEKRTFQSGMGILPEDQTGTADHFLLAAYITDFFPNFLTGSSGEGIRYQAEFAIAGKGSDSENLKSVLNRLLMIRMGLNYVYLYAFAPEKMAEARAMALIIASILLAPEAVETVTQILVLIWSYGESMMDLKTLLAGGNVPVIKDDTTWQLSLEQLASFSSATPTEKNGAGLSYTDHLILLLCINSDQDLLNKTLDLLEYNRRLMGDDPDFQIDSCITAIETEHFGTIGDYEFSIRRGYGYDMNSGSS